jgi:sugar O-acyltransferase (sialic acid O-acetyltransferase NeuD family)
MSSILIIGAGGHAKSSIDVIEQTGKYKIYGVINNDPEIKSILDLKIIGNDNNLEEIRKSCENAFIGIGQIKSPKTRIKFFEKLKKIDYRLPCIISPNSTVSRYSNILEASIIFNNVVVGPNSSIGSNCIINNFSLIEHDCIIGNNVHVSTNVTINGNVSVGNETFIGSGSTIKQGIKIGSNCFIKMGSVITKDLSDNETI